MASIKKKRRKKIKYHGPYSFEFRLRVVWMFLEERYPLSLICTETGVSDSSDQAWVKRYQEQGEDGLRSKIYPPKPKTKINQTVEERIVELKTQHPAYGPRRISDILKRFFLIRTSPKRSIKPLRIKSWQVHR